MIPPVPDISAFVRAHVAVALVATLILGAVAGYVLGVHREAQKPDACQAVAQTLLDAMRQGDGVDAIVGGDAGCALA
jgi:hypothetical protein